MRKELASIAGVGCLALLALSCDSGSGECGPNTMSIDGVCQIVASACGEGLTLDPDTSTCQAGDGAPEGATVVAKSGTAEGTAHLTYHMLGYLDGDGNTAPLATDLYADPMVPDDTPVTMISGRPLNAGTLPVSFVGLFGHTAPTLQDGATGSGKWQPTVADFKACQHELTVYKLSSGLLRFHYTMRHCLPNMLYTLWFSYGPEKPADPTDVDAFRAAQAKFNMVGGAIPNSFTTDPDGNGEKIMDVDPTFWFKAGVTCAGGFGCDSVPPIGVSQDKVQLDGSLFMDVLIHSTGQSNGNAGNCYLRDDGTCAETADEVDLQPPFTEAIQWAGRYGDDSGHIATVYVPLSDLQP